MSRIGIDHFNVAVCAAQLAPMVQFYTQVIGLRDGDRPAFTFPGNWLYAEGVPRAVLHLAAYREDEHALEQPTGRLNHICLNMTEPLNEIKDRLTTNGIEFREQNNPVNTVIQLFLKDPAGIGIELSFEKALS
ncbi:MAG: VOC family protein [Burkholderiaceae bacterium]